MAGKKEERIINYINSLPAGEKVSVRNLAKALSVSEGTAYKAIKTAEELHLVETRPRVGTIKLAQDVLIDMKPITLAEEIGRMGLLVLAGEENANVPIGRIVLGDGGFEQFKATISAAGPNALAILGDRPDLLFFAASKGVNMILTSNTQPGETLLNTAREHGSCVLSSAQDGSTIFSLLCSDISGNTRPAATGTAVAWMRAPAYLYYNDIAADWYSTYRPVFSLNSSCVVVDDNLNICGTVDAVRLLASDPSGKISKLYSSDTQGVCVEEETPMQEIARIMISKETSVVYITRDGELRGMVTANDVLRYYQHSDKVDTEAEDIAAFETISNDESRCVYTVRLGNESTSSSSLMLSILHMATRKYVDGRFGSGCTFASGTFFTTVESLPGDVMVSCEYIRAVPSGFVVETEIYDESAVYSRCVFVVALGTEDKDGQHVLS